MREEELKKKKWNLIFHLKILYFEYDILLSMIRKTLLNGTIALTLTQLTHQMHGFLLHAHRLHKNKCMTYQQIVLLRKNATWYWLFIYPEYNRANKNFIYNLIFIRNAILKNAFPLITKSFFCNFRFFPNIKKNDLPKFR